MTLAQLAIHLHGTLLGGNADAVVTGAAGYDTVGEHEITFALSDRNMPEAEASPALAIITSPQVTHSTKPLIQVDDPRSAYAKVLKFFDWRRQPMPGIDPTAVIARSAAIHARAYIGPYAYIGEGAVIGDGAAIYPHAFIGDHVEIGRDTIVYPQVTIYPRCTIGSRVILHAGVVIGADGHGFNPTSDGWERIPHLGTVVIEDDVEIGANTTVDRATSGSTTIGMGSKIDNLVMIAHNVKVGPRCMIVGQVGVSGSCVIEENVVIGGQAGLGHHRHIGAGARIAGQSGISRDVPAGATFSGYPAQNHADELRFEAALRRVPDLLATVKRLEKRLAELENRDS